MLTVIARKGNFKMRINESTYVDAAEKVIIELVEESKRKNRGKINIVTTSKIRNLLAMTADIYNQVLTSQKFSVQGVQTRLKRNDRFEISDRVAN